MSDGERQQMSIGDAFIDSSQGSVSSLLFVFTSTLPRLSRQGALGERSSAAGSESKVPVSIRSVGKSDAGIPLPYTNSGRGDAIRQVNIVQQTVTPAIKLHLKMWSSSTSFWLPLSSQTFHTERAALISRFMLVDQRDSSTMPGRIPCCRKLMMASDAALFYTHEGV
jgi:hypothetical protein